jgi:hypothetical protein
MIPVLERALGRRKGVDMTPILEQGVEMFPILEREMDIFHLIERGVDTTPKLE